MGPGLLTGLVAASATPVAVAAAVPEPTNWAMMLLGFGAVGVAMRRRRRPTAGPQFG
ncbi:MAG: PEPxxWA-CTERM sorting domain-containing protein [Pseudomonadota bacterium]